MKLKEILDAGTQFLTGTALAGIFTVAVAFNSNDVCENTSPSDFVHSGACTLADATSFVRKEP